MLDPNARERLYRVVADTNDTKRFIALLDDLRDQVCDIRTTLPDNPSVETRAATAAILTGAIDRLSILRNNQNNGQDGSDEPL